jgi:hypothetical protein
VCVTANWFAGEVYVQIGLYRNNFEKLGQGTQENNGDRKKKVSL